MTEELTQLREHACELIERCKSLHLATVDQHAKPLASYAPFYRTDNGDYFIFVSTLSSHTGNLAGGTASILIIDDEARTSQIYARNRLGFDCYCQQVRREDSLYERILDELERRHGAVIQTLRTLADFRLYRLRPESGSFVIGFGQAYEVSPDLANFSHVVPG
ncbi:MAG: pyridoxamine 5'-phosphate oxidase family protein [Gammaproteobacteria bacterium]|nr:pyridoxamine 5'-phosphate oxidase family protein [Gammaproteobacteria bacterium]MCY4226799.1 pyridoxamine 5'-phosphate oxidase family protein [Gammaproteobacteria bacterium]MCY4312863.1 pyridoxamine 5'-phosphate oxidase family protein [Gammaproteobacteria bacterium]